MTEKSAVFSAGARPYSSTPLASAPRSGRARTGSASPSPPTLLGAVPGRAVPHPRPRERRVPVPRGLPLSPQPPPAGWGRREPGASLTSGRRPGVPEGDTGAERPPAPLPLAGPGCPAPPRPASPDPAPGTAPGGCRAPRPPLSRGAPRPLPHRLPLQLDFFPQLLHFHFQFVLLAQVLDVDGRHGLRCRSPEGGKEGGQKVTAGQRGRPGPEPPGGLRGGGAVGRRGYGAAAPGPPPGSLTGCRRAVPARPAAPRPPLPPRAAPRTPSPSRSGL